MNTERDQFKNFMAGFATTSYGMNIVIAKHILMNSLYTWTLISIFVCLDCLFVYFVLFCYIFVGRNRPLADYIVQNLSGILHCGNLTFLLCATAVLVCTAKELNLVTWAYSSSVTHASAVYVKLSVSNESAGFI